MTECITDSPAATAALAARLGSKIKAGMVLCLEGDLGAGKTLLVQNLARALGVEGEVTSPTFNIMNLYQGRMPIAHFDLYRLESETELDEIGFYEYIDAPDGLVVIEWADKFPEALPESYIRIQMERMEQDDSRRILFSAQGNAFQDWIKEWEQSC